MKKNSLMRYIDSCVSNIARKIQDEFDESKHPRDKGGKFTSKGGEGAGGGASEADNTKNATPEVDKEVYSRVSKKYDEKLDEIYEQSSDYEEYAQKAIKYLETASHETAGGDAAAAWNYGKGTTAEQAKAAFNKMIEEIKNSRPFDEQIDKEVYTRVSKKHDDKLDELYETSSDYEEYKQKAVEYLENALDETTDGDVEVAYHYGKGISEEQAKDALHQMIEEIKNSKGSPFDEEENDVGYEEQERSPETDEKIKSEFEEGLDVVKQDADSEEEYRQKADEYLSWALDATAKTDEQAMENYGVSSKVVGDIVNKLRENLGSSSHYTETPEDKGKKQLESALKGWWTRADEMVEDLKDAGYDDVDYVNDELMYVSKDGVDYRVSLDKAGRTITAKRVEIV